MIKRILKNKRKIRATLAVMLIAVMFVNQLVAQAGNITTIKTVYSWSELYDAIEEAGVERQIYIANNITVPNGAVFGHNDRKIIIRLSGSYNFTFDGGSTKVTNIRFLGEGISHNGSYISCNGDVEFTNCEFEGISNTNSSVILKNGDYSFTGCTFDNNYGEYGAHVNVALYATANFSNCLFKSGTSNNRGCIHIDNTTCNATLDGCVVKCNTGKYGGGIANWGNLTITNTAIYNNFAVGGADIFDAGVLQLADLGMLKEAYHAEGIEPIKWYSDYTDTDYWARCYKLNYGDYVPTDPIDPTEEPTTENPTDPPKNTEQPTDPPSSTEEPTDPPESTETPTEAPEDTESTESPSGGDTYNDNHTEDNSTHTTTDDHSTSDSHTEDNHTEDNHVEDNSDHSSTDNSTHTDSHDTTDNSDHSTTDNSTHSEDHSTHTDNSDNSTHTDNHTEDNSTSSTTNTDSHNTDSHDSSVSSVDNSVTSGDTNNTTNNSDNSSHSGDTDSSVRDSNNTSTTNTDNRSYTYNTDKSKTDNSSRSSYSATGGSQPVNVTVNIPESENGGNEAPVSSQPNINIYSENVEVIYTASKDGGYSVDIKDKDNVGAVPLSATTYSSLNTEENKIPQVPIWVSYANMILLGILVILEITDKIAGKRNR